MPRIVYTNWSSMSNTTAGTGSAPFNGSSGVGGGAGWQDTGNQPSSGSILPLFRVNSGALNNSNNGTTDPGSYYFTNKPNVLIRSDEGEWFEDGTGVVKWSSAGRHGVCLRQHNDTGVNESGIAAALVDETIYIWIKRQEGDVFQVWSEAVTETIPVGSMVYLNVVTDAPSVIITAKVLAPAAYDITDANANPDNAVALHTFTHTFNCTGNEYLLEPGAPGVFMHGSGEATHFAAYTPSVELTAGAFSLVQAYKNRVELSVSPASGGDASAKVYDLKRNGSVIAEGISTGTYADATAQPGTKYTYSVVVTNDTETSESDEIVVHTMYRSGRVFIGFFDSNNADWGIAYSGKAAYKLSEGLKNQHRSNVFINRGVAGTSIEDWVTGVGDYMADALEIATNVGVTDFINELGTNDLKDANGPRTKAEYKANLITLVQAQHAACPLARVWLSAFGYIPSGTSEWSATGQALQDDYLAAQAEVAALYDWCYILDDTFLAVSEARDVEFGLVGDVHYNTTAHTVKFMLWLAALNNVTESSGGGGSGSGGGRTRVGFGL